MDGQPQFMRPAQHPFYVRKPLTFDSLHHSQLLGYNYGSKPVSFSVELPSRNGRRPQTGQLSEPHTREQSRSLRDIFERAILRGDVTIPAAAVALDHDNSDTGVTRQPSFITSSLPRKITRDGDDLVAVDASRGGSNDYFLDNSSESASESGWQNEAFMDDASSTVSDEIFKSSESPTEFGIDIELDEEDTHLTPLPNILDVSDITRQQGRSTLSGLFKPKYRDYPRNNVHRHSEKDHKEVIDSGTQRQTSKSKQQQLSASSTLEGSVHRLDPVHDHGRLPRTPFPAEQRERSQSPMSHYRYLPNHLGRKSPRPRSPRARTHQDTGFNDIETGDEIISIHPDARPAFHRSTGNLSGHEAFEQMEVEEPPWVKERQRRLRKCRRIKLVSMSVTLGVLLFLTLAGVGVYFLVIKSPVRNHVPESTDVPSLTNTTITSPGQEEKTFNGSIRITSENFTEAMWDLSSEPATNFSTRFCSAMDSVYNSNDFSYKGCSVTSLSKGSVIVNFNLLFTNQNETAKGSPVTTDSSTAQVPPANVPSSFLEKVRKTLQEILDGKSFGNFTVDVTSLHIEEGRGKQADQREGYGTTTVTSVVSSSTLVYTSKATGCASLKMKSHHHYRHTNCTMYRTCYDLFDESHESISRDIPCGDGFMFVTSTPLEDSGNCTACDQSVCAGCIVNRAVQAEHVLPLTVLPEQGTESVMGTSDGPTGIGQLGITNAVNEISPLSNESLSTWSLSVIIHHQQQAATSESSQLDDNLITKLDAHPTLYHATVINITPSNVEIPPVTSTDSMSAMTTTLLSTSSHITALAELFWSAHHGSSSHGPSSSDATANDKQAISSDSTSPVTMTTTLRLMREEPQGPVTDLGIHTPTNESAIISVCHNVLEDNNYVHPHDCHKFIYCMQSRPQEVDCLCDQMFDQSLKHCVQCEPELCSTCKHCTTTVGKK